MTHEQATSGNKSGAPPDELLMLSNQVGIVQKRNRFLRRGIWGLMALIVLVVGFFFHHFVWRYAEIDNIKITQDDVRPSRVHFEFTVGSGGLVRRGFEKAITEDSLSAGNQLQRCMWEWYIPPSKKELSVYIRYRWWILPVWQTKTFSLAGG